MRYSLGSLMSGLGGCSHMLAWKSLVGKVAAARGRSTLYTRIGAWIRRCVWSIVASLSHNTPVYIGPPIRHLKGGIRYEVGVQLRIELEWLYICLDGVRLVGIVLEEKWYDFVI